MRPDIYILQNLISINLYFAQFVCALTVVSLLNKLIIGKLLNGLALFSLASTIVFTVILNLLANKMITIGSFLQFVYVDAALFVVVLFMYRIFIIHSRRINFIMIAKRLSRRKLSLIIMILLGLALINYINVLGDGSSRIAFHQKRWYTFVRMTAHLINPLSYLLVFLLIKCKRTLAALFVTAAIVATSVLALSKAGFMISFAAMFLVYRDLVGVTKRELRSLMFFAIVLTGVASWNLYSMGINPGKLFERFVHYAEATIMVYPAADPTSAFKDNSTFSNIHRGIARLAGDSTATDIDTLYGYALSKEFYGQNTLTGPNARIGAYALCVFPGWHVLVLYTVIFSYLFVSWRVYLIMVSRGGLYVLLICPFYIASITHIVLDYNTAMALLTEMVVLMIILVIKTLLDFSLTNPHRIQSQLALLQSELSLNCAHENPSLLGSTTALCSAKKGK